VFESIKNIAVDRKNSLPIADLQTRYRATSTPVVFGDLTKHWKATSKWSIDYLSDRFGDLQVPIYSNNPRVNKGHLSQPALHSSVSLYFDELIHRQNDFRISNLLLSAAPSLEADFKYPRLGFDFTQGLSSLNIGRATAVEPMRQSSNILHTVYCHFGEPTSVLLIPPSQTEFVYPVGRSQKTVSTIDFTQPHFGKFPALKELSGYVADLDHGDALYIPAGFWHCTAYTGVGITLSLKIVTGSLMDYAGVLTNSMLHRLSNPMPYNEASLKRLELRTHRLTNAKFADNL